MKQKRVPTYDLESLEVTREEELHGTPTVPLALVLEKAIEDAESEDEALDG